MVRKIKTLNMVERRVQRMDEDFGYILQNVRRHNPFGYILHNRGDIPNIAPADAFLKYVFFKQIQDKYIEENGIKNPLTMVPFKANEYQMHLLLAGYKKELNNSMNYITDPLISKEKKKKRKECVSRRWDGLEKLAALNRKKESL